MNTSLFRTLLIAIGLALAAAPIALAAPAGWEVISTDDGIETARKNVANSPLFAFRGDTELNIPVGVLAETVLRDEIGPEWVDLMVFSKKIQDDGRNVKIIHQGYALPWPISDRDYVMRQTALFDAEAKVVTIHFESIAHPAMPAQNDYVRAHAYRTYWRLSKLPNGKTRAEVEVHTDPKGLLPSWLINLIQKDWPPTTLTGLKTRALKGDVPSHPDAAGW